MDIINAKEIKSRLKFIFKSRLFLIGIAIRIIFLIIILSLNRDLNDMNQLVLYAIQRLVSGKDPYTLGNTYHLTIYPTGGYEYYFGYPPVVLFLYLPVLLYPYLWAPWDFNIVMFCENMFFDFMVVYMLSSEKNRFSTYMSMIYWMLPFFSYSDYVTFYSSIFLFLFASIHYIDNPFKSSLFAFLAVGIYHLLIFMVPLLFIYQLRRYKDEKESAKIYFDQYLKNGSQKLTFKQKLSSALDQKSFSNAVSRAISETKDSGSRIIRFLLGAIPTAIMVIPFILWNWDAFKYSLYDVSASRYSLNYVQFLIGIFVLVTCVILIFIEKRHLAKLWVNFSLIFIFLLESTYLYINLGYQYPHYFSLIVPFCFYLPIVFIYNFRIFRIYRNKMITQYMEQNGKKPDDIPRTKWNLFKIWVQKKTARKNVTYNSNLEEN